MTLRQLILGLMLFFLAFQPESILAQRVIYVDQQARGNDDGTSVENAYTYLQDALDAAQPGDQILVLAGIYTPDKGRNRVRGDRGASFVLKNGVRITGGYSQDDFSPDHLTPPPWNWRKNPTILSGDLLGNDNDNLDELEPTRSENSLQVLIAPERTDSTAIIEGFIIESGHNESGRGSGLTVNFSVLNLTHLEFRKNFSLYDGGALYSSGSTLTLSDISFRYNKSLSSGGAIYTFSSQPDVRIHNALFEGNKGGNGGAIYIHGGGLYVTQSTFLRNEASSGGAVMHRYLHPVYDSSEAIYVNTSFLGNRAKENGGAFCNEDDSIITMYNSVFSGNETAINKEKKHGGLGGAIVNFENSRMTFHHTTMVNNSAEEGGGIYVGTGDVSFYNSIVQGNESDTLGTEDIAFIDSQYNSLTLDHNLLTRIPEGALDLGGNQFLPAQFVSPEGIDGLIGTMDDNLRHIPGSPAIDGGANHVLSADILDIDLDGDLHEPLPLDLDGNVRISNGLGVGMRVDLGAYEFNAGAPVATSIETPSVGSTCPDGPLAPAYPNPFTIQTTLSICVPTAGLVELTVYDILGRQQAVLLERVVEANQTYQVKLQSTHLSNGMYMVRLKHNAAHYTRPVILAR